MRIPRLHLASYATVLALGALACDETPKSPPVGSLGITTSMPVTQLTTADGWEIKINRFLVHFSSVNVAGVDGVLAASSTGLIVDEVAPGPKPLLVSSVRTARAWEEVDFTIGPATEASTILAPVTNADRAAMIRDGYAIYVEGTATSAGVTRQLKLGFATDTLHRDCGGERDGAFIRGLIVPPDGDDTADIGLDPTLLFVDDLVSTNALPRAAAFALADKNGDGIVSSNELPGVPLEDARAAGGLYGLGDATGIGELGGFVSEQTRHLVTAFRAKGSCIAFPAPVNR
jgi:hypothetical protein